ncbi:MAG: hypothetical protein K2X99_11050 [Gemmatimonadaceae bacterium]|nr:hypothetical protein [Gemmatimonadaceae bacterium]
MMRLGWLGCCAAALLGAQESEPSLAAIRDAALRRVIAAEVVAAEERGTPSAPLIEKALEGQLKGANAARIGEAVHALALRLAAARDHLRPVLELDEVKVGADALSAGLGPADLKKLRAAWPNRSVAMPLGVVTELVTRGVTPPRATKMVLDLMKRGATVSHLASLGSEVQRDVSTGRAPDAALDLRVRGIMSLLTPGATAVLAPRGGKP